MAVTAIGDVHGNLFALENLLAKVLPRLHSDDTLVFLGDYIDRGDNVCGCIDCIVRLQQSSPFSVVTLMGNHEEWMLRTMHDFTKHSWLIGMDAFATVSSYSSGVAEALRQEIEEAGVKLLTEKPPLPYHLFFDLLPQSHRDFFNGLQPYFRTNEVTCVHGGVACDGQPLEMQDPHSLIWGSRGWPDAYKGADDVVYGHWNNMVFDETGWPKPRIGSNRTFGLDTISSGVLTAMSFPDLTIYQSERFIPDHERPTSLPRS